MTNSASLKTTPLHSLHVERGAKMVPFAGYEMPVQYPLGVKAEHLHTREKAGLFDVSHMGQIRLTGNNPAKALEALVPVDIIDLPEGKQRYALFTNEQGGVMDDLMVTNEGNNSLHLVVNAACKDLDIQHLQDNLPKDIQLDILEDRALVAIQGPVAKTVMAKMAPATESMVFMDSIKMTIMGVDCYISRSGYTGEDGFEISIPEDKADSFCRQLLEHEEVELIGLGARDSLRLESGLCLYGHDLNTETTPIESALIWAISKVRRNGGERAGGFPGADKILAQIDNKDFPRKRIGLKGSSRAPIREGTELINAGGKIIGRVTSGTFGPTVEVPVAMGYVETPYADLNTEIYALVRGKQLPMTVSRMPFIEQRYHRG